MKLKKIAKNVRAVLLCLLVCGCLSCGSDREECAADLLYRQFASREGMLVAQLEGMQLNDSVKVDVVILEADDEAHWQELCREFDIRNQSGVVSWVAEPAAPQKSIRYEGGACCKVIASPARRTICFYQLPDSIHYESLMDYRMALLEAGE